VSAPAPTSACRRSSAPTHRDFAEPVARRQVRRQDTLAREAAVDRTAFYGTRPYARLRGEFESRLQDLQQAGDIPDPREAQIARLKTEITKLTERLAQSESTVDELSDFRTQALARLAACCPPLAMTT
jgi:septal ring factor EnvC (AmiA/AmiB activator)